jgi:hypothetical protein
MRAQTHPPLDDLRAFGDGETSAAARRAAAHLEGCPACRARLAALRARRDEIRDATVLAPPPQAWERILARRAAGEELILPAAGPVSFPDEAAQEDAPAHVHRRRIPLRRAAVLLVGVAGIASATVPGSPLRGWLQGLVAGDVGAPVSSPAAPPPVHAERRVDAPAPARAADSAPAVPADVPEAGIGVMPDAGEVRVVVLGAGPGLRIRVRLGDAAIAQVRGRGAAATAAFGSGRGRITVTGARAGELEVVLPRAARLASLTVDGTRFVSLRDGRLTVLVPADSSGAEIVFPGTP